MMLQHQPLFSCIAVVLIWFLVTLRIELVSWQPRAFIYHNFLSDEECKHLIRLAAPLVRGSDAQFLHSFHAMPDTWFRHRGSLQFPGHDCVQSSRQGSPRPSSCWGRFNALLVLGWLSGTDCVHLGFKRCRFLYQSMPISNIPTPSTYAHQNLHWHVLIQELASFETQANTSHLELSLHLQTVWWELQAEYHPENRMGAPACSSQQSLLLHAHVTDL